VKRKFDRITEYDDLVGREYSKVINWGLDDLSMIRPSIQFMEEDRKKPFFIVYQPVTPHHPFEVPDDKYRITGKIAGKLDYKKRNWLNYLNSLHYADSVLGEVIRNLEKKGLLENTLFFLMSDHGEAFYQHTRNYNHPFFLYEENVQVPFLIYNPHLFPQGYSYNGISRHLDIAPSILDLLGIPKEERHEGISLFSAHQEQMAMLHTFWNRDISAIRDGNWKYIRKMDSAEEELYDLALDPAEKKNLAALRPAITASYREKILALRQYKNRFFKTVTGNKFPERNEKRSSEKFR
jgi:arylsulfatase A-like enzyme